VIEFAKSYSKLVRFVIDMLLYFYEILIAIVKLLMYQRSSMNPDETQNGT